ncbi:hypothetical protein EXN66_Car016822 [Channa argus]|uniref:Uncharacterized protein n=1 Tax=Channa argus TaxID=215402 RepID=A0A6G1QFC2_CHAAH|nr:hypothetical protein EXN66_Car016822 [Channa argus]
MICRIHLCRFWTASRSPDRFVIWLDSVSWKVLTSTDCTAYTLRRRHNPKEFSDMSYLRVNNSA